MTEKEFDEVINNTMENIFETLIVKGKEYRRNNDPFHNFEQGVKRSGLIREKVLDGMLLKHEISISDMTNDLEKGILPKESIVHEKFNDNIIYLLLKKASILDKIYKNENNEIKNKYPFNEGDDYWTIENGEPVWSCWDDQSEEIYDENYKFLYFKSKEDAEHYIKEIIKKKNGKNRQKVSQTFK